MPSKCGIREPELMPLPAMPLYVALIFPCFLLYFSFISSGPSLGEQGEIPNKPRRKQGVNR